MITFKSQLGNKILNYYFLNPESRHYIRELAEILKLDPGNTEKKLKEFEREGLLQSEFQGKERYYSLNENFPLIEQYRQIFLKTVGIEKSLRDLVTKNDKVIFALIFGSYARNQMDATSDIDLLIVGNHSVIDVQRELNSLQNELGREINAVDMTQKEFENKKDTGDPFVINVLDNPHIKLK